MFLCVLIVGIRAGRTHQLQDCLDHAFRHRHAPHQRLHLDETFGIHDRIGFRFKSACGFEKNAALGRKFGIENIDLHQEAVELGFRQRIGAFLFQRVLGCQHMERCGKVIALACHRHMIFLHGLQKCRLGARRGAVDFVSHQKLRKNRPLEIAEGAAPIGVLLHDFRADNVGRHQVGRELDALAGKAKHGAKRFNQLGLGKARHADQKRMATGKHGNKRALNHLS